jgi:hypothetical protein
MSEWKCLACGKYLPIDHHAIKDGDTVTFTATTCRGRPIRCSTKDGVVLSSDETSLLVQQKRGKYGPVRIRREGAFPAGAPSSLSYQLFGTCDCKKEDAA